MGTYDHSSISPFVKLNEKVWKLPCPHTPWFVWSYGNRITLTQSWEQSKNSWYAFKGLVNVTKVTKKSSLVTTIAPGGIH